LKQSKTEHRQQQQPGPNQRPKNWRNEENKKWFAIVPKTDGKEKTNTAETIRRRTDNR
jgi:hypothetical protein